MKRKLLISISVFIFAVLSMVTTTLAWFSIAQSATVGELTLTVGDGGNLWVSLDGTNYYDDLTEDQFGLFINNNMKMTNVTTSDLVDYRNSYYGDEAVANVDYLSFTLYFRCDDEIMTGLYLSNNVSNSYDYDTVSDPDKKVEGTYAKSKGVSYRTPITFNWDETTERLKNSTATYYADQAVRIGIKELNLDAEDTRTAAELETFIFDPSSDVTRGYDAINGVNEFGAFDFIKKYVKHDLTAPTLNLPNVAYTLSGTRYGREATNNNSLCATFQKRTDTSGVDPIDYYYAKFQVSVWFEGWDPDCMDGIYNDIVKIQLFFRSLVKYSA